MHRYPAQPGDEKPKRKFSRRCGKVVMRCEVYRDIAWCDFFVNGKWAGGTQCDGKSDDEMAKRAILIAVGPRYRGFPEVEAACKIGSSGPVITKD